MDWPIAPALTRLVPDGNRRLYDARYLNRDHAEFAVCLANCPEWAAELQDRFIKRYQPECNWNRRGN